MSILINNDAQIDPSFLTKVKDKLNISKETNTSAAIIKQVSPIVLLTSNSKLLPKVKINNEDQLNNIQPEQLKVKENIETLEKIDDKIIEMEKEISKKEQIEEIDIQKYDDEEEEQKRLEIDKENLLKGFQYGFDPFGNCISSEVDDEEHFKLNYKSFDDRIKEIFGEE